MKKIVNLTPHEVKIFTPDGVVIVQPSGKLARVAEVRKQCPTVNGIPVTYAEYGEVTGLPAVPRKDTIYIVSALVLAAVPYREDVFAPGPAVRDEQGRVVGCEGLSASLAYSKKEIGDG